MSDVFKKIISVKPREKAGSTAYNRFDFQQNWAICKLLDIYPSATDFIMCFDYHDDLVLMDSATNPQNISFYQIKTKSKGNWSLKELLKTRNGKDGSVLNSFLGKLFYNFTLFPENTDSLNFISNAKFNLSLEDKSESALKTKINCIEISGDEIKKINTALKDELGLSANPEFEKITVFEVAQLSIEHHEDLTKAKLSKFIEDTFPGTNYQLSTIYKTIFGEIKRKATFEKNIEDQESLLNYKSITKKDFNNYLRISVLDNRESFKDKCDRIENRLNSEKVDFAFIKKFKQNCLVIEIDKMDRNNRLLDNILRLIKNIIKEIFGNGINGDLFSCMNTVFTKYITRNINQNSYDENYIKALILIELYEN